MILNDSMKSRRAAIDALALPKEAWRPVEPISGRGSNRVSEREFEKFRAHIELRGGKRLDAALWDFSLHGFAVLAPAGQTAHLMPVDGEQVRLVIDFGTGPLHADCMVKNVSRFRGKTRIGMARRDLSRRSRAIPESSAPEGECLRFPASLDVRAEAANPIFYGETAGMTLCGARPGFCLEFLCRDAAMPLFLGQELELSLVLPTSGDSSYAGKVRHLEFAPGGALKIRLEPTRIGADLANDLAELLAHEAGLTPETLQRFAFPTRFFRDRVEFRFVESMEEYSRVLNLRRNAYVEAGKRDAGTKPEEMSIAWDKRSRILCAFHQGTLVASAALTFPESEADTLRSETAFPGNRFPGDPPPKRELMEVNSLCTHKDYRKGDLLRAMFEQIGRVFVLSDRKYIMNLSDERLLPMYLGIGFKEEGHVGAFLGLPHHLIKLRRDMVTDAKGIGVLRWALLYGDLMEDLVARRMVRLGPWSRLRMAARLSLRTLANWMYRKRGEQAFTRRVEAAAKG